MLSHCFLFLASWEADVTGRAEATILGLRWKLITDLDWPFSENVCQLLVCLV